MPAVCDFNNHIGTRVDNEMVFTLKFGEGGRYVFDARVTVHRHREGGLIWWKHFLGLTIREGVV